MQSYINFLFACIITLYAIILLLILCAAALFMWAWIMDYVWMRREDRMRASLKGENRMSEL